MSESVKTKFPKVYGRFLIAPSQVYDGKFVIKRYVAHGGPHWVGDRYNSIADAMRVVGLYLPRKPSQADPALPK